MKDNEKKIGINIYVDEDIHEKLKEFKDYKPNRLKSLNAVVNRILKTFLYRRTTKSNELIDFDNVKIKK